MHRHDRDSIILKNLVFYGYHGVSEEEGKIGCRFSLDVHCGLDLNRAAASDELDDTISYALLYETIGNAFGERRFRLLEALARHVVQSLFSRHPEIETVRIAIFKTEAPIPTATGQFGIRLFRERQDG